MSCVRPLTAYWTSRSRETITFDRVKSATKVPFKLPCGQCIGCRLEKARQWGLRCVHEAKMWPQNVYVTLTYNDEFMPPGGSLSIRDLQLFMKRLRKLKEPQRIRFFAGGEYGEINKRPHYHLLLFNCGFDDAVLHGTNKRGEALYVSKQLERVWSDGERVMGFATIGAVTFDSAVYCAKYALKKVTGDKAFSHYEVFDADGVVYDRVPEFAIMSRRPGIGSEYFSRYGAELAAHDSVVLAGTERRSTRFYDERVKLDFPVRFDDIKRKRKRESVLARSDNTEERLRVKEKLMIAAVDKKERNL